MFKNPQNSVEVFPMSENFRISFQNHKNLLKSLKISLQTLKLLKAVNHIGHVTKLLLIFRKKSRPPEIFEIK